MWFYTEPGDTDERSRRTSGGRAAERSAAGEEAEGMSGWYVNLLPHR